MHWGGDFGMGFGTGGGFGGIFMILFWVLIIIGIAYFVKSLSGRTNNQDQKSESAQEVLGKRFARGEISKEEFEDAMDILRKNRE